MSRNIAALALLAVSLGAWPGALRAAPQPAAPPKVQIGFLGPSRAISHSISASRDTAVLQMLIAPRPTLTGGGEFSVFSAAFAGMSWRLGFFGLIELESKQALPHVKPIAGDVSFWRGVYGFSLAVSLDRLAERWMGKGSAFELSLSWRHESEHLTEKGGDGEREYGDVPIIGDFLMPDVAVRWRVGPLSLIGRLQWKIFVRDRAYTHAPGVDLTLRWHATKWVHPFASFFTEYVFGNRSQRVPDHYLVRGLLGILVPSSYGYLSVFLSGDVGHRKGLAVFTREATFGVGLRAAFF